MRKNTFPFLPKCRSHTFHLATKSSQIPKNAPYTMPVVKLAYQSKAEWAEWILK